WKLVPLRLHHQRIGLSTGTTSLVRSLRRADRDQTGRYMSERDRAGWRGTGQPMVRVGLLRLPAIDDPDLSNSDAPAWVEWLERVWHSPGFAEAISHASPDLDRSVTRLL